MGSKGSKTTKVYAPDPQESAQAQSQANLDAIYASALANRYNEVTPYGSITWQRPEATQSAAAPSGSYAGFNIPSMYSRGFQGMGSLPTAAGSGQVTPDALSGWTRTTTLSPEMQRQFDLQNQLAQSLQGQAVSRAGQLPQSQFQISGNLPRMTTGLDTAGLPQMSGQLDTQGLPQMVSSLDTQGLPSITGDYQQSAEDVEQATYQRLQQLMNPQFEERQRSLEAQLAATGNPLGSEGYQGELNRFQRGRQEADLAAALESVGAGRAEQSRLFDIASTARGQLTGEQLAGAGLAQAARQQGVSEQQIAQQLAQQARQQGVSEQLTDADLARVARQQGISEDQLVRNQQLNELSALIQGSPAIGMPTGQQPAQYQVAPADVMGAQQFATQTQLQNALANQQASSAKKGGTSGLIGTLGSAAIQRYSDRRLKDNIIHLGKMKGLQEEHNLYAWEWNDKAREFGLEGKSMGVMADEIEQYMPNLVTIDQSGYKMVNYGGL